MSVLMERTSSGWYLNGDRLPLKTDSITQYRAQGYWANMTIADILDESAKKWPDRIALIADNVKLSFEDVVRKVDILARNLIRVGISKGDIVTVQLPNTVEHVFTVFALAKIGAVCNLVAPIMQGREVLHIVNHCQSKAIIIPYEYHKFNHYQMIMDLSHEMPSLNTVIVVGEEVPGTIFFDRLLTTQTSISSLAEYRPDPDDISLIGFTSGTTALPKAYVHTHNTELANSFACMIADSYPYIGTDSRNVALPGFSWMYGRWCNLFSDFLGGATTILQDPFNPETVARIIKENQPTHIHAAPAMLRMIADSIDGFGKEDLACLKAFHYAGTTCPPELGRRLKGLAPYLLTCYGLSEVSPVCATSIIDPDEAQIFASGRPGRGNMVRITDPSGNRLQTGEEGEICVKGPGVTLGYFKQPEITKSCFDSDGFFHTGDTGYFEESGYLHVTGRIKDVIDRGGIKFSAREVEDLLLEYPKVKDVAIIGMPDPKLGERSCAFLVPERDAVVTLDEIVGFLREKRLATFKLPERLEIVESLPYTTSGKVQKYLLREKVKAILEKK